MTLVYRDIRRQSVYSFLLDIVLSVAVVAT